MLDSERDDLKALIRNKLLARERDKQARRSAELERVTRRVRTSERTLARRADQIGSAYDEYFRAYGDRSRDARVELGGDQ